MKTALQKIKELATHTTCKLLGHHMHVDAPVVLNPNHFYACERCGRCIHTGQTLAQWRALPAQPINDEDFYSDDWHSTRGEE